MNEEKGKVASILESPETITRRIERHIVRIDEKSRKREKTRVRVSRYRQVQREVELELQRYEQGNSSTACALDEERRAQKALILLRARDRKIALLERKIINLENLAGGGDSRIDENFLDGSCENSSVHSSGKETTYLSVPPTEASDSQRSSDEIIFEREEKKISQNGDIFEKSLLSKEATMNVGKFTIPRLKLSAPISNSSSEAIFLKNVDLDFNENSSLPSDESKRDDSSVDLVVTAALAFSKFDHDQWRSNDEVRDRHELNDRPDKKQRWMTEPSSGRNLISARMSTSLAGIKTRRGVSMRHSKWRNERKIIKTRDDNFLIRNLEGVQAGLDDLLQKPAKLLKDEPSKPRAYSVGSVVQKQKVEDKVVREDEQEAPSSPDAISNFYKKIAPTQPCTNSNDKLYDQTTMASGNVKSNNHLLRHEEFSKSWNSFDDPAPQWLIEKALETTEKSSEINRLAKTNDRRNDNEINNISSHTNHENIISNLEKQLCATRAELAEALNEQLSIKSKYKKALKYMKNAADEERDELQRRLVHICTALLEKFGHNALNNKSIKAVNKKHRKPLRHFGKLSRKLHRKLRIATLASSKLKQEVLSARRELDEKSVQYDSIVKCFASLKTELKNAESNLNNLLHENVSLRKKIDDTREWMQTRVSKERHEKINATQFREIQRSRELTNLKKKSEEDLSTIAQLRGKMHRLESANSNKGFLLNSYKIQLADLAKDKENLSAKIKELENENSSLRNGNAQLKANLTLVNNEKQKISVESEKSKMNIREQIQSKLAMKYERSMLQSIDTMREKYDKTIEAMDIKLRALENSTAQYFSAIKRFFKEIHDYHRDLDAERDFSNSEASEREAHETACEILNITPGELTGFLKGRPSNLINSWLSEVQRITKKKMFADDLGKFLFVRAIGSTKN